MSSKPVVMNNMRTGVGTTYLSQWKIDQAKGKLLSVIYAEQQELYSATIYMILIFF